MADVNKQEITADEKKEPAKKPKKEKVSFGAKLKKFWRDYKSELKKIVWSPWKQVRKNTALVIVTVIVISAVIGLLDFAFSNAIVALGKLV